MVGRYLLLMAATYLVWLSMKPKADGGLFDGFDISMPGSEPRGISNNNPGNLERNSIQWQGMSAVQTDDRFVQFDDPLYGIRAMGKTLETYYTQYDLRTINQIISRWAPPTENNTAAYVAAVSSRMGVGPDKLLIWPYQKAALIDAIIHHENGKQPYLAGTIENGLALA